uniref:Uncharacterized protein n=1 Tax=Myoviridae sp. ctdxI18 TaxID=2826673 RepID=A0A8S5M3J1_9CAUD|nr:MAG TPA: hypothetical protein [Myoviridae sp. ctdxI18]
MSTTSAKYFFVVLLLTYSLLCAIFNLDTKTIILRC